MCKLYDIIRLIIARIWICSAEGSHCRRICKWAHRTSLHYSWFSNHKSFSAFFLGHQAGNFKAWHWNAWLSLVKSSFISIRKVWINKFWMDSAGGGMNFRSFSLSCLWWCGLWDEYPQRPNHWHVFPYYLREKRRSCVEPRGQVGRSQPYYIVSYGYLNS